MTVYVDNARNRYGRLVLCHMLADSEAELHAFAARLGLKREWFHRDHYDISLSKRSIALHLGAIEVSSREILKVRRRLLHLRAVRRLA